MNSITCPVCKAPLEKCNNGKSVKCDNNHLFDFAKQGYLNLLLAQQKKSKSPGDDGLMVQSRTDFLNTGAYSGLAFFFNDIVKNLISKQEGPAKTELNVLDLACGEGYYGEKLHQELSSNYDSQTTLNFCGIDISTPAIKSACKRSKDILWLVASTANLPLSPSSQHIISGLFFHFDFEEIERVLTRDGAFITINTGPRHLIQLREKIYDQLKEQKEITFPPLPSKLSHQKTLYFRDKILVEGADQILNLLRMTPHYWRATKEKKEQILKLNSLQLDIDVQADIFIKS